MRKMKGFSFLLLCLVMVLTACGGGNGGSTNTSPTPTPANVAETTASPTEELEEIPNLNGRVIKIAAWWDLTPQGETQSEINRLEKIAEVEKKYNVKIEFVNVPYDEMIPNFTNSTLSGEPFADIVQLEYDAALPLIKQGLILPISEFTDSTNNINNEGNLVEKYPPIAGEYYAFESPNSLGAGVHYNRDLFKQLGLPDPKELYANGEWTWDKFLEIAKLATRDTDNDGKTDVYGFSTWGLDAYRQFAASNGVRIADEENLVEELSSAGSIETGEFLNKLYNVDKVVKIGTGDPMEWNEYNTFKDGDVAMFTTAEWNLKDLSFDFGIVPIPKGPNQLPNYTYADYLRNAKFIGKGVKDAALVYKIYEETLDIPMLEEFSGQEYLESIYGFEDDVEMLREHISGTGLIILDKAFPDFPLWPFVNDIIVNKVSPAAAAETYKAQAEASMQMLNK
ncbi:MAG: extracellular solute-binding protein [Candidatus Pristimantibacillus lignocellulolyticus]|uniref:Extracellular solute-binding protein n=1 Tax=Candidatus Pristimantibacillus lignocellulolyticus TaxID=2994561 RepID=A0A9J6ZFK8_9BACL|nr:MAG: extracellular solute-binding protein [Candidatus Pristimantibacillus lignocellulolyticus]